MKLLAYKIRDRGLCISDTKDPTYYQVFKRKSHYANRLYYRTGYTQIVVHNFYDFNNAERLLNSCLPVFPIVPTYSLI